MKFDDITLNIFAKKNLVPVSDEFMELSVDPRVHLGSNNPMMIEPKTLRSNKSYQDIGVLNGSYRICDLDFEGI